MKYEIIAKDYFDGEDIKTLQLTEKMEALATEFIKERELDIEINDLWNDATAEKAYEIIHMCLYDNEIFYADDFFEYLLTEHPTPHVD